MIRGLAFASLLACAVAVASTAYPDRSVRLIIPSTSGSGPDGVGRILASRLGAVFGQQIVVDNRAGANGILASEITARAAPDGYTLLITLSSHTINPHTYEVTRDAMHQPEAGIALAQFSIEPVDVAPDAFARFLKDYPVRYGKVVKAAGIEPQ